VTERAAARERVWLGRFARLFALGGSAEEHAVANGRPFRPHEECQEGEAEEMAAE